MLDAKNDFTNDIYGFYGMVSPVFGESIGSAD
jgi:hypothetical protein